MSLLIKFDALQWAISEYCTKCSNFKAFNSKLFKWCLFFCTLFTDTKINCNIGAKTTLEIEIKKYRGQNPPYPRKYISLIQFYTMMCSAAKPIWTWNLKNLPDYMYSYWSEVDLNCCCCPSIKLICLLSFAIWAWT